VVTKLEAHLHQHCFTRTVGRIYSTWITDWIWNVSFFPSNW